MSALVAGLQQGSVEAYGVGAYGVWFAGIVCHGDALAAMPSRLRCAAVGVAARVLAAVLWGVCVAYVLFAVALFLFACTRMVLFVVGRGVAAALGCTGYDFGVECRWHLAAAEDPHGSFSDRLMCADGRCRTVLEKVFLICKK